MNAFRRISTLHGVVALTAAALLSGCASGGAALVSKAGPSVHSKDMEYVAAVEQLARRRGVQVYWVNPPPEHGKVYVR